MKKEKLIYEWVKVFSVDGYQVLFTKEQSDEDNPCVFMAFNTDGYKADFVVDFETEYARDAMFEACNKDKARVLLKTVTEVADD